MKHFVLISRLTGSLWWSATASLAQDADPAPPQIQIEGTLVLASPQPGKVDKRLSALVPALKETFRERFQSFELAGRGVVNAALDQKVNTSLGNGFDLTVELLNSTPPNKHRVHILWKKEDGHRYCATTVTLEADKPLIIGGPNNDKGGTLILMVKSSEG